MKILLVLSILLGLLFVVGCKANQSEGPAAQEPLPALGAGGDPRNPPASK